MPNKQSRLGTFSSVEEGVELDEPQPGTSPELTAEQVLADVPDRPLSSLYEVAQLYAACRRYELSRVDSITSGYSSATIDAMTPNSPSEALEEEQTQSLIAARVDFTGEAPSLADDPVAIENLTDEVKHKVGFVKNPNKTSTATDFSITNYSGTVEKDVEKLATGRFLPGRFTKWPARDSVAAVADSHPDGHLIHALKEIGDDEDAMERLTQALVEKATFSKTHAVVTVMCKLQPDGDYVYPGEIPVFNKAARARRASELGFDEADGEAAGMVASEQTEVFGDVPGLIDQFARKQSGPFQNLDRESTWRSRPVSRDTIQGLLTFEAISDEFSVTSNAVRMYFLPYPRVEVGPDEFERFYHDVYLPLKRADFTDFGREVLFLFNKSVAEEQQSGDEFLDSVQETAGVDGDVGTDGESEWEAFTPRDSWLRMYCLYTVKGMDPSQVYVDEPEVSLSHLAGVAEAYQNLSRRFESSSLFGQLLANTQRLGPEVNVAKQILFGDLFYTTTADSPDPDVRKNQTSSVVDFGFTHYARLLRGQEIDARSLLDKFVTAVVKQQRSEMGDGGGSISPLVLEQYVQLCSLQQAGLLSSRGLSFLSESGKERDTAMPEDRAERLDAFIDEHEVLDSPESEAVFLLGGLVARLSSLQYNEGVSRKLTEQYPVSSINRRSIQKITAQVLEKNTDYEQKVDSASFLNNRYTSRLPEVMLERDPSDWNLTNNEMKWLYSLGIAYGQNDTSMRDHDSEDSADD